MRGWEVFNFDFEDLSKVPAIDLDHDEVTGNGEGEEMVVPTFYRGTLRIQGPDSDPVVDAGGTQHLACTYLDMSGWGKGIAWINSFNLGWYWPSKGPQMTLYVPGPVLKPGENEVIFLELEKPMKTKKVGGEGVSNAAVFTDQPNFYGPQGRQLAKPRLNRGSRQSLQGLAYE